MIVSRKKTVLINKKEFLIKKFHLKNIDQGMKKIFQTFHNLYYS